MTKLTETQQNQAQHLIQYLIDTIEYGVEDEEENSIEENKERAENLIAELPQSEAMLKSLLYYLVDTLDYGIDEDSAETQKEWAEKWMNS